MPRSSGWRAASARTGWSRRSAAEAVYRADLERNPENGWALFGLWQALRAQKQGKAAAKAEARFRQAWQAADLELTRSAF